MSTERDEATVAVSVRDIALLRRNLQAIELAKVAEYKNATERNHAIHDARAALHGTVEAILAEIPL